MNPCHTLFISLILHLCVMNILATIRRLKGIIAIIVAASILEVTVCDVLCGAECSPASKHELTSNEDPHQTNKSGHHKQDLNDQETPSSHFHQPSTSSEKDDCCEDITNQFYASLFKAKESSILITPVQDAVYYLVLDVDKQFAISNQIVSIDMPMKVPRPSIGTHLRILISSFLI